MTSCTPCPAPPSGNGSAACADPGTGTCGVSCNSGYHACLLGSVNDCKGDSDVNYCGSSCTPCAKGPNVATMKCAGGQCKIATCNSGYEDADGVAGNGCESPTPLSIQPSNLAVWLRADLGIVGDASGVSQWQDQSGNGNNATQASAGLEPIPMTGSWPGKPALQALRFDGSKEMAASFSAFTSTNGFTLAVAVARYGSNPAFGGIVGAGQFLPAPSCCNGDQAKLFAFGFYDNTHVDFERTCASIMGTVPANGASTYQVQQLSMMYSPSDTLYHLALGGSEVNTDSCGAGCYCAHSAAPNATVASNGMIGNSPDNSRFNGLIGEIILYKTVLTAADLAAIQSYLRNRWGTP
jgi:hypothetical protein